MTVNKSLKRRVRARMARTGERYAAARRNLVKDAEPTLEPAATGESESAEPAATAAAASPGMSSPGMSSEALARRTGRGWDEWFAILDAWGASQRTHPAIATHLRDELGVDGWWAQTITVGYERARGMRKVGQLTDGYSINATRTIAVPVDDLFDAFVDPARRAVWLPEAPFAITTATPGKSIRGTWERGDGPPLRVEVNLTAKSPSKSGAAVQLRRLPDADAAEQMRLFWRERLTALAAMLEG